MLLTINLYFIYSVNYYFYKIREIYIFIHFIYNKQKLIIKIIN